MLRYLWSSWFGAATSLPDDNGSAVVIKPGRACLIGAAVPEGIAVQAEEGPAHLPLERFFLDQQIRSGCPVPDPDDLDSVIRHRGYQVRIEVEQGW
jgi:hypothetical protein